MAAAAGFCLFDTAIGACGIAWSADEVLVGVQLPGATEQQGRARMRGRFPDIPETQPPAGVQAAVQRIRRLLEGERDGLEDLPLDMTGVPEFNQRVYEVARAIPPGRTLTYGEVAAKIGDPHASRAVGAALGNNPFAPVVPCHRVLAAGNRSGGFSAEGGVDTKLRMLEIESAQFGAQPGLFSA